VIKHEDRLRRAKYLGALADRLFRDECARLGLNADEAIKSPLLSIITRQGGHVVTASKRSPGQPGGGGHHETFGSSGHTRSQRSCNRESRFGQSPFRSDNQFRHIALAAVYLDQPLDVIAALVREPNSVQVNGWHHYYAHDMSGWHQHDKECRLLRGVVSRKSRNPAKS
jgi:hypothetical protein